MKHHENIEDLFKRNEHKLDEMPPSEVWNRLERNLDNLPSENLWESVEAQLNEAQKKRPSRYRYLAFAAAVLVLIAAIPVLLSFPNWRDEAPMAMAKAVADAPSYFEDLGNYSDSPEHYYLSIAYSKKYEDRMKKPIPEGQKGRKLYATTNLSNNYSDVAAIEKPSPAKAAKRLGRKTTKRKAERVVQPEAEFNIEIGELPKEELAVGSSIVTAETSIAAVAEAIPGEPMASPADVFDLETEHLDDVAYADGIVAEEITAPEVADDLVPEYLQHRREMEMHDEMADAAIISVEEEAKISTPPLKAPEHVIESDYAKDYATAEPLTEGSYAEKSRAATMKKETVAQSNKEAVTTTAAPVRIASFQWLIGDWTSSHKGGISKESWQQTDASTLTGTATLTKNGVVLFSESLRIQQSNTMIFCTLQLDDSGEAVRYILKELNNETAIFNCLGSGCPGNLIIQRNKNTLETRLEYDDENAPENTMLEFMKQRNEVKGNRITRKLQKQ